MGGKCGSPRTCKGLFSGISYRLSQLVEEHTPTGTQIVLQRILPDIVPNGRGLSSAGPLANYGKRGKVLGPVVGAYGEMSDDVYVIAEAVAEELAHRTQRFLL